MLAVKGSGGDLGTLTAEGLALVDLERLRAMERVYEGLDREDDDGRPARPRPLRAGRSGAFDRHAPCTDFSRLSTSTIFTPTR